MTAKHFLSSAESHSNSSVVLEHPQKEENWTFLLLHEFLLQCPVLITYKICYLVSAKKIQSLALAGVAQWIEHRPVNQGVAGLIPSRRTCLGCRPGSW